MRLPLGGQAGQLRLARRPAGRHALHRARMAQACVELLADIDEETVDFVPNYDGSTTEPTVCPAASPTSWSTGAQGIAVGMASSIPPHNRPRSAGR